MSGPYHMRAVCPCGFTAHCNFGNIGHLTHHGRFIEVCPDCGESKYGMEVKVLRWHEGTWRDKEGKPYNGVEPEESKKIGERPDPAVIFFMLLFVAFITCLVLLYQGKL